MDKNNMTMTIYYQIRSRILSGEYKVGDQIGERSLCEEFGVSRTPVRESLKLLQREKWVTVFPKKGTFVSEIDYEDIKNIHELRIIIEPEAVALTIKNIENSGVEEINKLLGRLEKAIEEFSTEKYLKADLALHQFIIEKAGNNLMTDIVKELNSKVMRLGTSSLQQPKRERESLEEWKKIIKCIKEHDSFHASRLMSLHITNSADAALRSLKKGNKL